MRLFGRILLLESWVVVYLDVLQLNTSFFVSKLLQRGENVGDCFFDQAG